MALFHSLWLVSAYFLFLTVSVLGDGSFLRICPFLPGCPFYWHIVAYSSLLWCFDFCRVYCNFFFIFDFSSLNSLPHSSSWNWLKVYQFCFIFSKNQFLVSLIYCFLHLYFIYFCSDLYDFFASTDLGFLCSSFSSCFRCNIRLLGFFSFLRWDCTAVNFPLKTAFAASHRF